MNISKMSDNDLISIHNIITANANEIRTQLNKLTSDINGFPACVLDQEAYNYLDEIIKELGTRQLKPKENNNE